MAFTCPVCGMVSHNPNNEREGYCGGCNDFVVPLIARPGDELAQLDWALAEARAMEKLDGKLRERST